MIDRFAFASSLEYQLRQQERADLAFMDVESKIGKSKGESGGPSIEMPRYRCHKEVWALQIAAVEYHMDGSATIAPRHEGYAAFYVPPEFVTKHIPPHADAENTYVGGYYTVYKDGYASFSPAQAFEEGYTRI